MLAKTPPPSSINVQMTPDLPEDGQQCGRCLQDLFSLREEWRGFQQRALSPEQVRPCRLNPTCLFVYMSPLDCDVIIVHSSLRINDAASDHCGFQSSNVGYAASVKRV